VWPLETLGAGEGDHPMVLVPAGAYPYGSDPARDPARFADEEADDAPRALPAFYVETFEYPDRRDEPPLASVSWRDARALCDARGRRLCTEPEWEAACEGPAGAVYGYGDAFAGGTCAAGDPAGAIALSGAYDKCVSPFGAFDLPGNLSEWTLGAWTKAAGKVVARSGAFASEPRVLRCANRIPKGPDEKSPRFGFRCCLSVDAAGVRPGEDVDGDRGESYVWSDGAAVYPKPDRHAGVELGKLRARTRVVPVEIVNLPDGNYGLIRVETPIGGGWMDVDALAPWLRVDLDGDGAAELVLVRPAPCTKKPAKCDGELVVGEGTGAGTTVALPGLGGLRPSTLELHSYGSGASSVRFLAVSADDFVVFYRLDGDRTARLASYRATHLRVTVQFPAAEDPAPLTIHVFDGEWDGSTGHIIEILYEWDGTALTEF
ncbi:MAG TPA: SUMF1/EgtB/PvdO family nonheme iron enzyme, partial [Myxococcota bacterium]|nr:SUMF1/EgtB/PvdO family nonheme iron enzyme [Myxococcota bacterium]